MKKLLGLAFIASILSLSLSCEKEDLHPDYPFTIVVKTFNDSTRIQNAYVEILATKAASLETFFEGSTNQQGEITFEYDQLAVFAVRATRGANPYTHIGCTEVRLEPNKEVFKTVYIKPYDEEFRGCTFEN